MCSVTNIYNLGNHFAHFISFFGCKKWYENGLGKRCKNGFVVSRFLFEDLLSKKPSLQARSFWRKIPRDE